LVFYLCFLFLDVRWNFPDWGLDLDLEVILDLAAIVGALVGFWLLAKATAHRISRTVSLLACVALLAIGLGVLRSEPLTHGLFARESASPRWYRYSRLALLACPLAFWLRNMRS
jgi:hypothetical protein